ncbi:hypothetical protein ABT337_23075 [Saccharopolyspora hirsuta]|uniref:Tellurium resistance protein TerC n=1 Tax=Saccharopolyspora hirsuta TaxID=1837 RepID=A0A5M7C4X7_SACHI|nr:hypothetical protein [Saccharopolyspora hirsuta]KAA5834614.1 hypothetical protein F1721_13225 [Saccharopolyspora hirsuta]
MPAISWFAAVGVLLALVAWDLTAAGRDRPLRRCALIIAAQLLVAVLFGAALLSTSGADVAARFFAGWGTSLASTVDLLVVLLSVAAGTPEWGRVIAVVVVVGVLARGTMAFGEPGTLVVGSTSVLLGAAVLWGAWQAFRREGSPPRAASAHLVLGTGVLAAAVLGLMSASAAHAVTGSGPLALVAGVLALVGFQHVFGLVRGLLARMPDAPVGLAVVLVFIGVKSVLAGLAGTGPVHDAQVVLLTLGVLAAVAALGAITAARAPRERERS